ADAGPVKPCASELDAVAGAIWATPTDLCPHTSQYPSPSIVPAQLERSHFMALLLLGAARDVCLVSSQASLRFIKITGRGVENLLSTLVQLRQDRILGEAQAVDFGPIGIESSAQLAAPGEGRSHGAGQSRGLVAGLCGIRAERRGQAQGSRSVTS